MEKEDLKSAGLTDEEQISKVLELYHKEFDPVSAELEKTKGDLETSQGKNKTYEESFKKFEGIDPGKLQKELGDLKEEMQKREEAYAKDIADRDFHDMLGNCIREAKGLNVKAITALLDVETLKASKNQKEDVAAAIKKLTEADDSRMLFGEPPAAPIGTGNPIGTVGNNTVPKADTLRGAIAEHYKVN